MVASRLVEVVVLGRELVRERIQVCKLVVHQAVDILEWAGDDDVDDSMEVAARTQMLVGTMESVNHKQDNLDRILNVLADKLVTDSGTMDNLDIDGDDDVEGK